MTTEELRIFIDKMMWRMIGVNYKWGGDDFSGFDCSGGIIEILSSVDLYPIKRDTTAQGLYQYYTAVKLGRAVPYSAPVEFGDLLFFGKDIKTITHVAMAKTDDIMFEFGGGGSKTTTADAAIQANAYGRFRPLFGRSDHLATTRILALHD